MATETELKPCPFCGGLAGWGEGEQKTKYGNEQVYCTNCFATTMPGPRDEAAEDWNVRADHAPEVEKLSSTESLLRLKEELLESAEKECDELAACLRNMMLTYERRIRSDCTPAQLEQRPWRVAEYVAAEEALADRAVLAPEGKE